MDKRRILLLVLVASLLLAACGGSSPDPAAQATEIAAGVAATLAAQAAALPTANPSPAQMTVVVTPPPPPTPTAGLDLENLRLAADGSGDLPTLKEALAQSAVGATITLGPGTYRLDEALTVAGSLHLVGAGRDQTEIVSATPDWVLRFLGDGPFTAVGISFRHEGSAAADVVAVASGAIRFQDCRFTGGAWSSKSGIGSGLFLEDAVTGAVSNCEASDNGLHGIFVRGESGPVLTGNTCAGNGDTGIVYFDRAGGAARENDCSANKMHGIFLRDWAAPTLEGNILRDNGDAGIAYFGNAAGLAQGNVCTGNADNGIYVGEDAAPALMDNECPLGGTAAVPAQPGAGESKIAFVSDRDGNPEIYIMTADGGDWQRLTDNDAADISPKWSPDGARIAFLSTRDGNAQLYVMNADGSEQTRLTEALLAESPPSWSPDGSRIAFTSYAGGGGNDIYVLAAGGRMDAWGNGATRLTTDLADDSGPTWSPDGARIAFLSDRTGEYDVNVMNADGSEQTPITMIDGWKYDLQWSPDGRQMLFILEEAVWVINADGTNARRVSGLVDYASRAAWAPDSGRILYQYESDLWLLDVGSGKAVRLTEDPDTERDPSWWGPTVP